MPTLGFDSTNHTMNHFLQGPSGEALTLPSFPCSQEEAIQRIYENFPVPAPPGSRFTFTSVVEYTINGFPWSLVLAEYTLASYSDNMYGATKWCCKLSDYKLLGATQADVHQWLKLALHDVERSALIFSSGEVDDGGRFLILTDANTSTAIIELYVDESSAPIEFAFPPVRTHKTGKLWTEITVPNLGFVQHALSESLRILGFDVQVVERK